MPQYTSYYLYQKYVKYGDQDWIPVYPTEYSISGDSSDPQTITKKQDNDPECGYTPPVVRQYRWVEDGDNYICDDCGYVPPTPQYRTISGTPYCTGYDKMVDTQYQVSYDSGSTWSTVSSSTLTVEHNSQDCGYVPPTPPSSGYANQYLTFRALEDGSKIVFKNNPSLDSSIYPLYASLDSGSTWYEITPNTYISNINSGETIMFKATIIVFQSAYEYGIGTFKTYGNFEVEGNAMSLKYGDNFSGQTTLTDDYAFRRLFSGSTGLTSAENLVLPATTLTNNCYESMFSNCTSLTTAPELPATTLSNFCYQNMFYGCSSLTTAPALPATTLAQECYRSMFGFCTSLTTAPVLSATTLANGCYQGMFINCTSLTAAPVLSATTLAERCYDGMFNTCTNLSSITCLATDISASNCTYLWIYNVASSGAFIKASSMNDWNTGGYDYDGIPSGWTVQDYQG